MNDTSLLQNYDLKVTPQRLEIISILNKSGHINIDDLYVKIKKKFSSISLATIYKNINTMKEKLLISELQIPDDKNVYELIKSSHSHIVCTNCSLILDVDLNLNQIENQVKEISSFSLNESSILFKGLCPKCIQK